MTAAGPGAAAFPPGSAARTRSWRESDRIEAAVDRRDSPVVGEAAVVNEPKETPMRDNKRGTIEDPAATEALRRALEARRTRAQSRPPRIGNAKSPSSRGL
jgi:hypothetical protein